jgi:hypothetical protein
MAISDEGSLPVAVALASASPHEVTLVEGTLACFTGKNPDCLIADRAYDSDPLDQKLKRLNINLIAPHRVGRVKPKTQDGRSLGSTKNDGESRDFLPGFRITGGWLPDTNTKFKTL